MKPFTAEDVARWSSMVGQKVWKNPKTTTATQPKPFKSGRKVNTVKSLVLYKRTGHWAFEFEEDDSVVECFRCSLAPEPFVPDDVGPRGLAMPVFAARKIDDGFVPTHMYEGIILRG